jgi:hypothetical protein
MLTVLFQKVDICLALLSSGREIAVYHISTSRQLAYLRIKAKNQLRHGYTNHNAAAAVPSMKSLRFPRFTVASSGSVTQSSHAAAGLSAANHESAQNSVQTTNPRLHISRRTLDVDSHR